MIVRRYRLRVATPAEPQAVRMPKGAQVLSVGGVAVIFEHSWENFAQATLRFGFHRLRLGKMHGWYVDLGVSRWYWAWFVALLIGCAHVQTPSAADRSALDAVHVAWSQSGLPSPGACGDRVEVRRHQMIESYVDACDGMHPGLYGDAALHSAGCLTTALRGVMGREVAVVHVAPGYLTDPDIVGHEAIHALYECAYGNTDAQHSDPRAWTAAGGASSVQSRARSGPGN